MKLHAVKFAGAGALAAGISYIACALFFYLWPSASLQFTAQLFLLKSLEAISGYLLITPMNIVSGLIQTMAYSFFVLWIMALLYNCFLKDCCSNGCGPKYDSCRCGVKTPQQPPIIR